MNDWKQMMKGCFGIEDRIFGGHPCDEKRAREMLKAAIDAKATMEEIVSEAVRFLEEAGSPKEHIQKQVAKIRSLKF